jgi:N utilization substance protein B
MRKRRAAREQALRWLYEIDVGKTPVEEAVAEAQMELDEEGLAFARELLRGATTNVKAIDASIARYAKDWSLDRMPAVDRNILRLAIFEILHLPEVPNSVAVDEAVELAKTYSTAESSKFVNGVLGALLRDLEQQARVDADEEAAQ